ncbi:large ribosomal subunit protein eL14 [Parasteatoda tepidariorum]|uniref:large ribosomal subunit protein eL14 n=1 Tax=Parasteatoda tepidariorum TaxID=114398 RepID=UPI000A2BFC86|nr:60S ribosomal protein L14 isoform X2 [Parasteatoda tepidariorum]
MSSQETFRHYVQIGRVAYISFGKDAGKLCTIVDVVDQNRAVVDGPCTGVDRQAVKFKRLRLTKFRLRFPHSTSSKIVRKAWEKEEISKKWSETSTAKKMAARKLKTEMTDFDRFRVYKARQQMNRIIRCQYLKLKGKLRKNPAKPRPKRFRGKKGAKKA